MQKDKTKIIELCITEHEDYGNIRCTFNVKRVYEPLDIPNGLGLESNYEYYFVDFINIYDLDNNKNILEDTMLDPIKSYELQSICEKYMVDLFEME